MLRGKSDTFTGPCSDARTGNAGQGPLITVNRTFAIMLYLIALGMIGARIFGGIDLSQVVPLSLMTIATANMVIAQTLSNKQNKPD